MNLAESRAVIAAMRDFKAAFRAFTAEIARSPREVRDRYRTDIELYYRSSFLPRVRTLQSESSVLRLLKLMADAARAAGKPASVCGEMASEPLLAFLPIRLGYET